jgi:hypothetical protein
LKKRTNLTVSQQVRLGEYGVADILAWSVIDDSSFQTLLAHVIEVKKGKTGIDGLFQLARYMKAVEMNFSSIKESPYNLITDVAVYGNLFCEEINDTNNIGFLLAQMHNISIYKYVIGISSGIKTRHWPGWIKGIIDSDFHTNSLVGNNKINELLNKEDNNDEFLIENPYILFTDTNI